MNFIASTVNTLSFLNAIGQEVFLISFISNSLDYKKEVA
jgi:hypothetical protein